jgi:hypothetical protein
MPSHRIRLSGEWWASWQTPRDGAERIATQQVEFNRRGNRSRNRAAEPSERAGGANMTELCEVVITAPDPEWLFRPLAR